jgi:hypothetical protein
MEFYVILWNFYVIFMELYGILWNFMELYGILWNLYVNLCNF